jgi:hypothetical protein
MPAGCSGGACPARRRLSRLLEQDRSGPLAGKAVNVKWYLKREASGTCRCPRRSTTTWCSQVHVQLPRHRRGGTRTMAGPTRCTSSTPTTCSDLIGRGVKVGVATGVRIARWKAAEIYPTSANPALPVSARQAAQLALFGRRLPDVPRPPLSRGNTTACFVTAHAA